MMFAATIIPRLLALTPAVARALPGPTALPSGLLLAGYVVCRRALNRPQA